MSYLQYPRLAFSGLFQSDVSTVNNDPRHFDISTFEPHFQQPTYAPNKVEMPGNSQEIEWNGWWNPFGTGIFSLKNCVVQSALGPDGQEITRYAQDAAIGLTVGNAGDQPSGKMVDLDPDWQLASCIYGQIITLQAPNGQVLMRGAYAPNPFRDLWFNRVGNSSGDRAASAIWQTQLTGVEWNLDGVASPLLQALKAICEQQNDTLSLRLTTYGYDDRLGESFFSYGLLLGAIGPAYPTEPQSFVLGRRFIPAASLLPAQSYQQDYIPNVGWFSAQLVDRTLYADLSNALPLRYQPGATLETSYLVDVTCGSGSANAQAPTQGDTQQYWQQPFIIAQLLPPDPPSKPPRTLPDSPYLQPTQYRPLATIDISNAGLLSRSGIVAVPISDAVMPTINSLPLALVTAANDSGDGLALLLCCEGEYGWEVRADQFALRLDPNGGYPDASVDANTLTSTVFVAQYGVPLANGEVTLVETWTKPQVDSGDCPTDNPPQTTPKAAPPTTNLPQEQIHFTQASPRTDGYGRIDLTIAGPKALGYPRGYLDGQLFNYSYNFAGGLTTPQPTVQQTFDQYAIVVRSSYTAPSPVDWSDVQPILQQYANLYPVMSQGLFDFSQREQADANAFILKFVLDKPDDDPDQMPVTRDLSSSKRRALVDYFDQVLQQQGRPKSMLEMFGKRCPTRGGGARTDALQGAHAVDFAKGGKR
ncbi:hypothetical protein CXB49_00310 [Chromobacterium sp. ATCC 53434]|uniref:hypothetical protein n=1 Tax=Chromobacterium sp. (strain ATCC 53434 / SC 14030) TaxID=2059672 RepID=UPI000C77460F|nr:hypothetical protein [Chromobacterium sp. ATCC 53434]AUH49388.1 hypothetical protein CXB49_00310 [Chromobacterium sp. ATCC 53434]